MSEIGDDFETFKMRPISPYVALLDNTIGKYVGPRGNLNVSIQDQFTPPLDFRFSQVTGTSTLAVETAIDDVVITVADGTEFTVGESLVLVQLNPAEFYSGQIKTIAVNDLTVTTPINAVFEVGSFAFSRELDISSADGSVTTEIFEFTVPIISDAVDVTRFMFTMECSGAPDDSKFGDLVALTNGIVLRKVPLTESIFNYWNIKTNGDFASFSYDVTYTDKAGAGNHGVRIRMTYGGQDKHGVTIRLNPGERLELLVQDDLTDLVKFLITIQGHLVED